MAKAKKPDPDMEIHGTTGLRHTGGFIDEEFLRRLQGRQGVEVFKEMRDNSPVIGSVLFTIESLIRQVDWRVEPANDTAEALAQVKFIEECMHDMSITFDDFISEVLSMICFGWSWFEIMYKFRRGPDETSPNMRSKFTDGKVAWRRFDLRAQETLHRWDIDEEGGIQGMIQMDMFSRHPAVHIPIEKSLLFRTRAHKNNPEGKSLLRPGVIPYHFVKRIQEYEAIGIERDLAGLPVFEVPLELLDPNAPAKLKALRSQFEKLIQQVRVDERMGALVPSETTRDGTPSGYKFKLLTSGSRKSIDADKVIKRYESRLAMILLGQFILLGQNPGQGSSLALAGSATELFGVALGSMMDQIATVFNNFAIRRLQAMNGMKPELDPKLVHGDIDAPPLDKLAAYVSALTNAGLIIGTPELENKLLEHAQLPLPDEEDLKRREEERQELKTQAAAGAAQKPPQAQAGFPGNNADKEKPEPKER